jgi:hypothetical protein
MGIKIVIFGKLLLLCIVNNQKEVPMKDIIV